MGKLSKTVALVSLISLSSGFATLANAAPKPTVKPVAAKPQIEPQQAMINKYVTTYDTLVFIKVPEVSAIITKILPQPLRETLTINLNVAQPIGFNSGFLVLSGCKAHYCDTDQADVWYNPYSKDMAIRIRSGNAVRVYTNTEWQYMPEELRILIMGYQAPAKPPNYLIKVAK